MTINPVSELIRSGGKPYSTPQSLAHPLNAQTVPPGAVHATLLNDDEVNLPEDCARWYATFVVVGFNQQAMEFGERWTADLATVYPQDGTQKDVRCLQVRPRAPLNRPFVRAPLYYGHRSFQLVR